MKRLSWNIVALSLLTGCASSTSPQKVPIPANLTTPCRAPVTLNQGADMGELLTAAVENNYSLTDCTARHKALVELVK